MKPEGVTGGDRRHGGERSGVRDRGAHQRPVGLTQRGAVLESLPEPLTGSGTCG